MLHFEKKKYICIPRSFLVINICNQGKTLCSPCIYIQQDATLHSLFISGNCSICFGWYLHPSSGAHTTVSTASGICHTVTATCRYRGGVGNCLSVLRVAYCLKWHLVGYILEYICDARTRERQARLLAGRSGGPIPAGARQFYLFQNVQTCFGTHPTSYSVGSGVCFSGGYSGQVLNLTTNLHLVLKLTHCGRVTQICVFNTVKLGTSASSP